MTSGARIRAVFFDWDGTLVNSKEAILASYRDVTTAILGAPYPVTPEDVAHIIPMRAQESFGSMSDDPEVVERLIAGYHEAYLSNRQRLATAYPGAVDAVSRLRDAGLAIGVVTSKGRARVDSDAEAYGFTGLVDGYMTGDVSAERKPHPGPILELMAIMGLSADEVLMCGDAPADILSGRDAGVPTVWCRYGFHGADECEPLEPPHAVDAPAEIVGLVMSLRGTP